MSSRVSQKQANQMVRAQLAKEQRRRRATITALIAVAVLVAAGLIGWGVYTHQKSTGYETPANATADGMGLVAAQGPVLVETYIDYMCPYCGEFERSSASTVDKLISDGKIQYVIHPIAFLDEASNGTKYSTRASASAACASDGGKLLAYNNALFAKQPAEASNGLTNDELITIGKSVGLGGDFESCVKDGKYLTWVPQVTDAASRRGIQGTPTVYVAGKELDKPTAESLLAAVNAAS
jgi:protein-disulfide isomerase